MVPRRALTRPPLSYLKVQCSTITRLGGSSIVFWRGYVCAS